MIDSVDVLVVGTGALANLFAARLATVGTSVGMLGTWPDGLAALQRNGVCLVDAQGREQSFPVRASSEPGDFAGARLALVLVKAWQTQRAAHQIRACLAPDGIALSLQNGLGNKETLSGVLGKSRVGAGVTTTGATLLGPGRVRPGGEGQITLGVHPHMMPLANLMERAHFRINYTEDLQALLWGKLLVNAAINPLTALLRIPNGELLSRPAANALMAKTALEVADVALAQGIRLPFDAPVSAATDVARKTAANHSSMLQDVSRGAPTEIDAICGAVVRAGRQTHMPTPTNYALLRLVCSLNVC
jgi:2-dehydropantoate 2-reductase